jgi:hypothetical protein
MKLLKTNTHLWVEKLKIHFRLVDNYIFANKNDAAKTL